MSATLRDPQGQDVFGVDIIDRVFADRPDLPPRGAGTYSLRLRPVRDTRGSLVVTVRLIKDKVATRGIGTNDNPGRP